MISKLIELAEKGIIPDYFIKLPYLIKSTKIKYPNTVTTI